MRFAGYQLGLRYFEGRGVTKDLERAVALIRNSAEKGHLPAQAHLGNCLLNALGCQQDPEDALAWFETAATKDYPAALFNLGAFHEHGLANLRRNAEIAASYYRQAADKGSAVAQVALAILYEEGRGVEQDFKKAIELYNKAALKNDPQAFFQLGKLFEAGKGVAVDPVTAFVLYVSSAQGGQKQAAAASRLQKTLTPEQLEIARQRLAVRSPRKRR